MCKWDSSCFRVFFAGLSLPQSIRLFFIQLTVFFFCGLSLYVGHIDAQIPTASLTGTVMDSSSALLVGAEGTIRLVATGSERFRLNSNGKKVRLH